MSQLQNTLNHIEMHPAVGSAITIIHVILASVLKIVSNGRLNPLLMDILQSFAWVIAIVCGCITIAGFLRKGFTALRKWLSARRIRVLAHKTRNNK